MPDSRPTSGALLAALPFAARQVEIMLHEDRSDYAVSSFLNEYAAYFDKHSDNFERARASLEAISSVALARSKARHPGFNGVGSILRDAEDLLEMVTPSASPAQGLPPRIRPS